MSAAGGASSISVTIRVRPFTIREAAQLTKCDDSPFFLGDGSLAGVPTPKLAQKGLRSVIKVVDDKCLVFDPPEDNPVQKFSRSVVPQGKRVKDQTFGFDRIFDENTSQGDVYESTTRSLLDSVLDGYNATVFAYGATGCGKTHTITGTAQQPGIIFMTMQELFERIGETTSDKVTEISLSYLEIYNETIRDLLLPGGCKGGLMLREDANQAVSVAGLSSHHPQNVEQVMEMIMRGNECRTISPTEANATSSRSHAVLQINVAQKDRNADVNEPHTMATLSIIDLAGSERASATKNRGERLIEGANINRSLLALGSCINALCDPRRRNHVPYRNSKLTRLLKFSLGGNCKTVMIVCVSPSSQHFDETQNTLRYANRAKNIQTKVTRNVYNVNRHVKDFLVKIDEQIALINELKAQQKEHETLAFAKFRKQNEKKESIAREGIARIRAAHENSTAERQEKMNNMIKLRQIGRRIAMLSSWIAAFDSVCDNMETDEPMKNMHAIRKTAQGILLELENSRHHCNQKVTKSTWDRALNSALDNGLRQLKEVDTGDVLDAANLSREVELLRANAERDALLAVAEQDKFGDAATVQVLLQAHFETISCIESLNRMNVDEAVEAATGILGNMLMSCTKATSHVVKPDGSIAPVELFAPTKSGTPKRKKAAAVPGLSPAKPILNAVLAAAPHLSSTPVKGSPRRKGMMGSGRKGLIITPKKRRSPIKGLKRGVRWRDDTADGTLAEFEKTPQRPEYTPEAEVISTADLTLPPISSLREPSLPQIPSDSENSSPPQPSINIFESKSDNTPHSRFQTGFLSKKIVSDPTPSPDAPTLTRLSSSSPSSPSSTSSPLRDLPPNHTQNRPPAPSFPPSSCPDGSDTENNSTSTTNPHPHPSSSCSSSSTMPTSRADALKIRSALKRASLASSGGAPMHHARVQRRRSPTAAAAAAANANASGSPTGGYAGGMMSGGDGSSLFSGGFARRLMGNGSAGEWKVGAGVLSPRGGAMGMGRSGGGNVAAGSVVGSRRMTVMGAVGVGEREREKGDGRSVNGNGNGNGVVSAGGGHAHQRMSSVSTTTAGNRGSLMPGAKGVWR